MSMLGEILSQLDHLTAWASGPTKTDARILDALPMRTERSKSYHLPLYLYSLACGTVQNRFQKAPDLPLPPCPSALATFSAPLCHFLCT